jgi:hypothetical protein
MRAGHDTHDHPILDALEVDAAVLVREPVDVVAGTLLVELGEALDLDVAVAVSPVPHEHAHAGVSAQVAALGP